MAFLDPVLDPLLQLGPAWTLIIMSVLITLITTIVYKYTTDQNHLKALKKNLKKYQRKMMAAKNEPEKAMKLQKEVMKLNSEYMMSSLKSTLYTFLPIILLFSWLSANLAFAPLMPDQPFSITAQLQDGVQGELTLILPEGLSSEENLVKSIEGNSVTWNGIKGAANTYDVSIRHSNGEEQFASLIVTNTHEYIAPENKIRESPIFDMIVIGNEKLIIFPNTPLLKSLSWFWTYFVFSIVFSTAFRKLFKVA